MASKPKGTFKGTSFNFGANRKGKGSTKGGKGKGGKGKGNAWTAYTGKK